MADRNDGGPAFPATEAHEYYGSIEYAGMSLRDWFAGKALAGLSSGFTGAGLDVDWFEQYGAKAAYHLADAMIAAREDKS